jgi:hypothetical protein
LSAPNINDDDQGNYLEVQQEKQAKFKQEFEALNFNFKVNLPEVSKDGIKSEVDPIHAEELQGQMTNALDEIDEIMQRRCKPTKEGNQLFNNIRRK